MLSSGELVRLTHDAVSNVGGDRMGPYQPTRTLRVECSKYGDFSTLARHPHDDGVLPGGVGILDDLPAEVDAVVSMCRVRDEQVPSRIARENRVEVRLVDSEAEHENPHLDFVLGQVADGVAEFGSEGKTVLLHGVHGRSRTPAVAALYAARHSGVGRADALC